MVNSKKNVLLIFGGTWSERDVSIKSAQQVQQWISDAGFIVRPVRWDHDGWVKCESLDLEEVREAQHPAELLQEFVNEGVEVAFNCLHGGAGEDGTVAALFQMFRIAHTGAGVSGSAISACKVTFRQRLKGLGINVPKAAVVHREVWRLKSDEVMRGIVEEIGLPCIVKDPFGGSSDGVSVVSGRSEVVDTIGGLLETCPMILVEQFLYGKELSIPCLGSRQGALPQTLQSVEICLPEGVPFDRKVKDSGKYVDPESRQLCDLQIICPSSVDTEVSLDLSRAVRQIHLELDLGTLSRTDVMICGVEYFFLETNTCPGMTHRSLVPLSAKESGFEGPELVRRMLDAAISQHLGRATGGSFA